MIPTNQFEELLTQIQINPTFGRRLLEAIAGGAVPQEGEVPYFGGQQGWNFRRPVERQYGKYARTNVDGNTDEQLIPVSINVTDPDIWVEGDMYSSIMYAYDKVREKWGGSSGNLGSSAWGEILIPPGVYQLSNELLFEWCGNLTIRGYGSGGDEVATGGVNAGGQMTQLLAPATAGKYGIRTTTGAAGFRVVPGPCFENIHIVGNATAAGGWSLTGQDGFRVIGCGSSNFTNGTDITISAGGFQTQYNYIERFYGSGSKFGADTTQAADATWVHCVFNGNRNGNIAIPAGSLGFKEQTGANRSLGLIIQGYDQLHYNVDSIGSCHLGIRYEWWTTGAYRAGTGVANSGPTLICQTVNNSLGGSIGTAFQLDAGAIRHFVTSQHVQACALKWNDASGNDTNNAWIEGQFYLGRWNMNNSGGLSVDMWSNVFLQGAFGLPMSGVNTVGAQVDRFPVYDQAHNLIGYVPVHNP